MKMQREKLIEIWGVASRLTNERTSVKFHYLMLKNKRLLDGEVESIQTASASKDEYKPYHDNRIAICEKYCELDSNDKPKIINGSFVMKVETKEEFDEKLEELREKFKDIVDAIDAQQKEVQELLKEEIGIELVKIPISIMPDKLLGKEVEILLDIIEDK